jgi:hypothetical protein
MLIVPPQPHRLCGVDGAIADKIRSIDFYLRAIAVHPPPIMDWFPTSVLSKIRILA